jgi:small multidrug resistance family-3 protein
VIKLILFFVIAGLFEITGGYLVWLALREGKSPWLGAIGIVILGIYGAVPTLQPTHFSRAYAAYGGIFIMLSILWGWLIDKTIPDKLDILGSIVIFIGVLIMMYSPRN